MQLHYLTITRTRKGAVSGNKLTGNILCNLEYVEYIFCYCAILHYVYKWHSFCLCFAVYTEEHVAVMAQEHSTPKRPRLAGKTFIHPSPAM